MAVDVRLVLFSPEIGAVVLDRWLGHSGVLECIASGIKRSPERPTPSIEVWGRVSESEVRRIARSFYRGGLSEQELDQVAKKYPPETHWWMLEASR